MQIIKFQKLNNNKYKIIFKDHPEITLYDDVILKFNLLNHKSLTENEFIKIKNFNNELESYYKSLKYLTFKMRTKKEIITYLKKDNYSENIINKTINRLEKEGYIDEKKYIEYYIKDQVNLTLNGPLKIKNNLVNQDLDIYLIEDKLSQISNDIWQEKIVKIINKRLKVNKNSEQIFKRKIKDYLFKEGYSNEMTSSLIQDIKIEDSNNFNKEANLIYQKLQRKYENKEELIYYLKNKLYTKGYSIDQINDFIEKIK